MVLVKHFKRLVFAQVVLGIVAFCMAERNPGLLLVAGAIAALSWYVTEGPSGKPLPRWAINLAGLAAVGWLVWDLAVGQGQVIVAMGHLIMGLQIAMLYAHKQNRDYVPLMVLSLLQMVGASVLSVSMIYGLLLVGYCVLALYTVLLFQLKVTRDQVHDAHKAAAPKPEAVGEPKPVVGRGHRWQFRFTAIGIGVACFGIGMAVFVVMPRSSQGRLAGKLAGAVGGQRSQTGFSDTVELDSAPGPPRSGEPVLDMSLSLHHQPVNRIGRPLLLRGAAMDHYATERHTWSRSSGGGLTLESREIRQTGLSLASPGDSAIMLQAQITLRDTDNNTLFTIQPPASIDSQSINKVRFSALDNQLETEQSLNGAAIYSVRWPMNPGSMQSRPPSVSSKRSTRSGKKQSDEKHSANKHSTNKHSAKNDLEISRSSTPPPSDYAAGWSVEHDRVARLSRRILQSQGLSRTTASGSDARDQRIAKALAQYLATHYRYTLKNPPVRKNKDPVIDFLFNRKAGHCELFAAAHAALCRSIGMQARLITGYRASEFNSLGGYYVVRPDDAHAWTEVYVGPGLGWKTYDATPPRSVAAEHATPSGWLSGLKRIYEYGEYLWVRTVVAYDQRTREAVMHNVSQTVRNAARQRQSWVGQVLAFFRELPRTWRLDKIGYTAAGIVIVMLGLALASLARLLILRRRKLAALQLTSLPSTRRRGLAKKLRFYLSMLEMLERHGYTRPEWQSPFGFARELADANPMRFDPVIALTEIFYEVRFGHREVDAERRQRIRAHFKALERALAER